MIARLIEFSARNRPLIFALTLAACVFGWWSMRRVPLDAIPDLSDTQVIVYSKWDRSHDIVEDQVTYPIVTALLGAPKVRAVRGFSDFGYSYVYVIFEDGTDLYWARSRAQEYLAGVLPNLPPGVKTELGPDANGLGWIYEYALQDDSGRLSPADLRNTQDSLLRYHLRSVPGVAEVASLGGFVAQYQIIVDPARLRIFGLSISQVADAVRRGNTETGGRLLEFGGSEYVIRGRGYLENARDFEEIALPAPDGMIVKLKDVGHIALGPEMRRGIDDLFDVPEHDIRVARTFDDDRFDVQVLARSRLLPFRHYRVVFFAANVDILDFRQFLKRANLRHAGGALRELTGKPRSEDFFEIERLLERLARVRNDGVDHHDPPNRMLGCDERHE